MEQPLDTLLGGFDDSESLLIGQLSLLQAHASGASLEVLFEKVVALVEREVAGATGSILFADTDRRVMFLGVAPNLPEEFRNSIGESPYGNFGTCARALHEQMPIVVEDMRTDPHWVDFQPIVTVFGFESSWSHPFFDSEGALLGTLGVYFSERRRPSARDMAALSLCAHLCGIFVTHDRMIGSLRDSEFKYRTLVEAANDTIVLADLGGEMQYVAPNAHEYLGVSPENLTGMPLTVLVDPDEHERLRSHIHRVITHRDHVILDEVSASAVLDGPSYLRLALSARVVDDDTTGLVAVVSDVSSRKASRSQLQFVERMNTVGTLAAGVAHEINNPLTFISANLVYLSEQLEEHSDPVVHDALRDAVEGTQRVTSIVRDLRTFARSDEGARHHIPVRDALESAVRLAKLQMSADIRVEVCLVGSPAIFANDIEVGQVFINILLNAAQAMAATGGDHIQVSARQTLHDTVLIQIADSGPGISAEVLPHIFEPFFTTKSSQKGTGLGLSIVHNIIERHEGTISAKPSPTGGTTFEIELPSSQEAEESTDAARPALPTLRVLFIDDEEALGLSTRRLLKPHVVHHFATGRAALEQLEVDRDYDAIVVDLIMPEMSGAALYQQIRKRWPDLEPRVRFVSGGAISEEGRRIMVSMPDRFLSKPFTREQLLGFLSGSARGRKPVD